MERKTNALVIDPKGSVAVEALNAGDFAVYIVNGKERQINKPTI